MWSSFTSQWTEWTKQWTHSYFWSWEPIDSRKEATRCTHISFSFELRLHCYVKSPKTADSTCRKSLLVEEHVSAKNIQGKVYIPCKRRNNITARLIRKLLTLMFCLRCTSSSFPLDLPISKLSVVEKCLHRLEFSFPRASAEPLGYRSVIQNTARCILHILTSLHAQGDIFQGFWKPFLKSLFLLCFRKTDREVFHFESSAYSCQPHCQELHTNIWFLLTKSPRPQKHQNASSSKHIALPFFKERNAKHFAWKEVAM